MSTPNSHIIWTIDSKPLSFLAYNFKLSIKRRWFILFSLLEKWYALSNLHNITVNGITQSTNSKGESGSLLNIFRIISTPPSDWSPHPVFHTFWQDKEFLTCLLTPTIPRHYNPGVKNHIICFLIFIFDKNKINLVHCRLYFCLRNAISWLQSPLFILTWQQLELFKYLIFIFF